MFLTAEGPTGTMGDVPSRGATGVGENKSVTVLILQTKASITHAELALTSEKSFSS